MSPFLRVTAVIAFALTALALSGCGRGKGFVEGWRDNSPQQSGVSPEEYCESQEGYSWINGSCQKDSGLNLNDVTTEEQCANIKDAFWVENTCLFYSVMNQTQCDRFQVLKWSGEGCDLREKVECEEIGKFYKDGLCYERPEITFTGSLDQSLTRAAALTPVTFAVAEGTVVKLTDATCPGYFVVTGNQIVSSADYKLPENQGSCAAKVVANRNGIESSSYDIKVTFSDGFLSFCSNLDTVDGATLYFVARIMSWLEEETCDGAAKSLVKQTLVVFEGDRRIVKLDPLFGLSSVKVLIVTGSSVEDVKPIASLTNLSSLDLTGGKVKDISALAGLKHLKYLYLDGNPIVNGKTEQNCPTAEGTNEAVKAFCLAE